MFKIIFTILIFFININSLFAIEFNEKFLKQFESYTLKSITKSETTNKFNGNKYIVETLGELKNSKKIIFNTTIFYVSDKKTIKDKMETTWYYNLTKNDTKQYSLYYRLNKVTMKYMKTGDMMFLGKINNKKIVIVIFDSKSEKLKNFLELLTINNNQEENEKYNQYYDYDEEEDYKELQPVIEKTDSIYSDTSVLEKYKDFEYYTNPITKQIIFAGIITKIRDGDTIEMSNIILARLFGIDTPEKDQICLDKNNRKYKCGIQATRVLEELIGEDKHITCIFINREKYGRYLLVCKNEKYNINQELVRRGWALSYFNDEYKKDEDYAKKNKLGLWSGKFQEPSEYRKQRKNNKNQKNTKEVKNKQEDTKKKAINYNSRY